MDTSRDGDGKVDDTGLPAATRRPGSDEARCGHDGEYVEVSNAKAAQDRCGQSAELHLSSRVNAVQVRLSKRGHEG